MPKYVCDFEQVRSIADNLAKTAQDYGSDLTTYEKNINSNLHDWESPAKSAFTTTNATQVATSNVDVEFATQLSNYIKDSATSIENLEEELAGAMKI